MRSAEEILKKVIASHPTSTLYDTSWVDRAMKEYAKEAIEACAKSARTKIIKGRPIDDDEYEVDKQSILNLINELK